MGWLQRDCTVVVRRGICLLKILLVLFSLALFYLFNRIMSVLFIEADGDRLLAQGYSGCCTLRLLTQY